MLSSMVIFPVYHSPSIPAYAQGFCRAEASTETTKATETPPVLSSQTSLWGLG